MGFEKLKYNTIINKLWQKDRKPGESTQKFYFYKYINNFLKF